MRTFSIIAPALEDSNTIYRYTPILERKITSKTKFIRGLCLYLEMRKRDSPDLWKLLLAGKSVEPSFQRIWASYSHPHQYSGDRQKTLEARAKIKAFQVKERCLHQGSFSLETLLFPSPLFCSLYFLKEAYHCPSLCFCQKQKQSEYCTFHCTGSGKTYFKDAPPPHTF